MPTMVTHVCRLCGKEFECAAKHRKFCSQECAIKGRNLDSAFNRPDWDDPILVRAVAGLADYDPVKIAKLTECLDESGGKRLLPLWQVVGRPDPMVR